MERKEEMLNQVQHDNPIIKAWEEYPLKREEFMKQVVFKNYKSLYEGLIETRRTNDA